MTEKKAKKIVRKHLSAMRGNLGLSRWRINTYYGKCDNDEWAAQCLRKYEYRTADITIDPYLHHSKEDVLFSLRHELLHLAVAEFDLLYSATVAHAEDEGTRVIWTTAVERSVEQLEFMLDTLGVTFKQLTQC